MLFGKIGWLEVVDYWYNINYLWSWQTARIEQSAGTIHRNYKDGLSGKDKDIDVGETKEKE